MSMSTYFYSLEFCVRNYFAPYGLPDDVPILMGLADEENQ